MSPRIAALLVMLGAALFLVAGAGARTQPSKKLDLTDPAAVDSYLRSIGIDPASVVKQVGLLNYAGPNCPGVDWNCTTSTKALQITTAGGHNKFQCTPEDDQTGDTDEESNICVIMQDNGENKAHCQMKDTGEPIESQKCVITQDGERNLAIVDQLIEQRTDDEQDARQVATVMQTATEKNQSQIHQDVKQDTKTGTAQLQNVHQVAIVDQVVSGSENFSHVHQNQQLSQSGAASSQIQNTASLPSGITDCDLEHKPSSNPNACASVAQTVSDPAGGKNESHLHQNIHEQQRTTAMFASQQQEFATSGIEGDVDQTNPPDVGTNKKVTHQDGRQRQEGPDGTSQNQIIDPACCGTGTTIGAAVNKDEFHQTAIQSSTEDCCQALGIIGDTNHVSEPPEELLFMAMQASSNVCTFHHHGANNEESTAFTFTVDPCVGIQEVTTACFNGEGSFCTPPPGEELTFITSTPTRGEAIAPPDFGEPSTFDGPIFSGI